MDQSYAYLCLSYLVVINVEIVFIFFFFFFVVLSILLILFFFLYVVGQSSERRRIWSARIHYKSRTKASYDISMLTWLNRPCFALALVHGWRLLVVDSVFGGGGLGDVAVAGRHPESGVSRGRSKERASSDTHFVSLMMRDGRKMLLVVKRAGCEAGVCQEQVDKCESG